MSHAIGAVRFPNNEIFFYEYNGTCDVIINPLYKTQEEVEDNWRTWPKYEVCNCPGEPVEIFSTYGSGYSWLGKGCKEHKQIVGSLEPDYDTEIDGYPPWSPWPKEEF